MSFRPIPPNDPTTKDWTAIAWPTNIQSKTPDGRFGPAKGMEGWLDCWFLSALAAVANDPDGHQILAQSIKQVDGGYDVLFKGAANNNVFISDAELQALLKSEGGDADTRLMELAAEKFFNESGNFKSLYISAFMKGGMNQEQAERCLLDFCNSGGHQDDPMTFNPMHHGCPDMVAFLMLTGMYPDCTLDLSNNTMQSTDVMRFLDKFVKNDRDGVSVTISAIENPLGDANNDSRLLVVAWDAIRTDITRNKRKILCKQEWSFLNALAKWLATPADNTRQALQSAAERLRLRHVNPEWFVGLLDRSQIALRQNHRDMLRSGVLEVLGGGPGYIGFAGKHCGNIEGINEADNQFTYSEINFPALLHIGELSHLIQAIENGKVYLSAVEPTTEKDDRQRSEHAGTSRGRRLRQLHNQVVRDGKIDQAERGSLADLMAMDDDTFRQVYDSDNNGVIEGGELKAVQLRIDQWVEQYELTPIW